MKKSQPNLALYILKVSFTACQFTFISVVKVQTRFQAGDMFSLKNIIIYSISSQETFVLLFLSGIIHHSGAKLTGHQEVLFMLY
jgi:hypothetical protein